MKPPSPRKNGFTLVEVAIALGVVSFTLVPLLVLISQAFNSMQASNEEVRCSVLAQRIIADAQMKPFSSLADTSYFLDLEGRQVPKGKEVLNAEMKVENVTGLLASGQLRRVRVKFTGAALGQGSRTYSITLSNTAP